MKRITLILSTLLIASLAYCKGSSGPVGAVESLADAACDGNYEEFSKYINEEELINRTMDTIMKSKGLEGNDQAKQMMESMKPRMQEQWEAQMKKTLTDSKGGPDCDSEVELVSEEGDTAKVSIVNGNEEKQTLELAKNAEGQWEVVFFDEIANEIQ